jgi:hypothetical protein
MRIKILCAAESDLEQGHRFYEAQADGLGTYFLDTLYSDIDSLAYFAGIHRIVLGYQRLLSKRFPSLLIIESLTTKLPYSPYWIADATQAGQGKN